MDAPTDSQTDRPTLSALKDRRQTDTPDQHGLDAKSEVIRVESRPDYETLIAEYYARYHPTVPEERDLVDILIQSTWLRRRYMSIEAGVWERGFYDTGTESFGLVFDRSQNAFDKAGRRINSASRNFHQALKQLRQLQAQRADQPDEAPDAYPLASRDCEGAVPEIANQDEATKPLTPKLVSFRESAPATPQPEPSNPNTDEDPPKAA